jgi:hypothetical protein
MTGWRCPVCGETEDLQGIGPFILEPVGDGSGASVVVPTKIWCMYCQKEYAYKKCSKGDKEKVRFT